MKNKENELKLLRWFALAFIGIIFVYSLSCLINSLDSTSQYRNTEILIHGLCTVWNMYNFSRIWKLKV